MKKIIYAGSELVTGDAVAVAVMQYSKALAEEDTAETIEIPVLKGDRSPGTALILVGPASQIVAVDCEEELEELEAPDTVARLEEKARLLRSVAKTDESVVDNDSWIDDY